MPILNSHRIIKKQRTNLDLVRSLFFIQYFNQLHFVAIANFLILFTSFLFQELCYSKPANIFRTYVYNEPSHLDSHLLKTTSSNHLLSQLHRNLLRLNQRGELVPELAQKCFQKESTVTCQLKKNIQWNDGSPITNADFMRAYEFILTSNESLRPDLLFPVKNAEEIFLKKKKFSEIGIILKKDKIIFQLKEKNSDFIFHLANIILAPKSKGQLLFSGPYELESWTKGKNIVLNPHRYFWLTKNRPELEFKFINDDSVALNLYEKNQLDMVRRLPTLFIPSKKTRTDYLEYPLTRFDFLAFNQKLLEKEHLRTAVSQALDFHELKQLYHSKGLPGCASLPPRFFTKNQTPCLKLNLKNSKLALGKADPQDLKNLTYGYSTLGGDDIKRSADWIQIQLKKNIALDIQPIGFENKIFLQKSIEGEFSLFHKGVPLEIPTCAEALKQSQIKDPRVQTAISKLLKTSNSKNQKFICTEIVQQLLNDFIFIPTGHYNYSILARPGFDFEINELNQIYF